MAYKKAKICAKRKLSLDENVSIATAAAKSRAHDHTRFVSIQNRMTDIILAGDPKYWIDPMNAERRKG
jgi:hypothetical protein